MRGAKKIILTHSATAALDGKPGGAEAVTALMDAIDTDIAEPAREIDKPLLMSVEDVFSISGRGTVATGRIERGIVKVGEEIEIVGMGDTQKTTVTGVEMFRKQLDQGMAGDNAGILLRGVDKEAIERGQVIAKPGSITPHTTSARAGGCVKLRRTGWRRPRRCRCRR